MLLNAGADPNGPAADGAPVLAKAVELGDRAVVTLLLDAGADPHGPGVVDNAVRSGNSDIAHDLVEAGVTTVEALTQLTEAAVIGLMCLLTLGLAC